MTQSQGIYPKALQWSLRKIRFKCIACMAWAWTVAICLLEVTPTLENRNNSRLKRRTTNTVLAIFPRHQERTRRARGDIRRGRWKQVKRAMILRPVLESTPAHLLNQGDRPEGRVCLLMWSSLPRPAGTLHTIPQIGEGECSTARRRLRLFQSISSEAPKQDLKARPAAVIFKFELPDSNFKIDLGSAGTLRILCRLVVRVFNH